MAALLCTICVRNRARSNCCSPLHRLTEGLVKFKTDRGVAEMELAL